MNINFNRFIQIAGIVDLEEAELILECGVRFLGFPLRLPVNKEDLTEAEAESIIKSIIAPNYSVLITYLKNAEEIGGFCEKLGASIVQLHGDIEVKELAKLKTLKPDLALIKSLVVSKDNFRALIRKMNETIPYVDAFITDTYDEETGASGATGKRHNWDISKIIVALSTKPVILAGGINPENAYEAIKFVKPAGIDSHTGVEGVDGRKDRVKVDKFVKESMRAFEENE